MTKLRRISSNVSYLIVLYIYIYKIESHSQYSNHIFSIYYGQNAINQNTFKQETRQTGRKKGFSELFNGIKGRIETAMQSDDKSQK